MTGSDRRTATLRAAALVAAGVLAGCATNPATGEQMLSLVSEGQEIQMGREYSRQVEATMPLLDDPELQAYVASVGRELAAVSERPDLPWSFTIIDDPTVNAFALPGGPVYVTRGILTYFESEAELAAVLGHEIGHITARHSVEQISRQQLAGLGLLAGSVLSSDIAQYADLVSQGVQVLFLSYSRDDERESDRLGVRYGGRAGYDVRESVTMHEKLLRTAAAAGRSGMPSWLSTHPSPEDRIARLEAIVDTFPASYFDTAELGRDPYLDRIDGVVYGENPREGYFRGDLFLHPELRFELRFPFGWRTANMPRAVTAVSPREHALLELTLAGRDGHRFAARQFFGQAQLQAGRIERTSINGAPATVGTFRARTQGGLIDGLAAFLDYGGLTYRILGLTGAGGLGRYQRDFEATMGSFDRLTDPVALAAEPMRLDVRRVDEVTSIAALARAWPTPVDATELAIVNGVGVNASIPAGTRIKWVVGEKPR